MQTRIRCNFRSSTRGVLSVCLTLLTIGAQAGDSVVIKPDGAESKSPANSQPIVEANTSIVLPAKVTTPEELVKFVRAAAVQVQLRGEAAFTDFRQPNSRWWQGDQYLFVNTFLGQVMVNPVNPKYEGKNEHSLRDLGGRAVLGLIQRAVSGSSGEGWAHYRWTPQPDAPPQWKSTYAVQVKAPSGKLYIVGSGLYDVPENKLFITDVVNKATELVGALGPDAFEQFRETKGPFRFGDTYVFVFDSRGNYRVYGADPKREGTNAFELKDKSGRQWARELPTRLGNRQSLWYECEWPRPGSNEPQLKHCLLRKVVYQGENLYVGSGWYPKSTPSAQSEAR